MEARAPGISCPPCILSTVVALAVSLEGSGSSLGTWVAGVMGRVAKACATAILCVQIR